MGIIKDPMEGAVQFTTLEDIIDITGKTVAKVAKGYRG